MSLVIKNLSVAIGKKDILKDISLEIKSKELHVLMGPNGSGKTTLAKAVLGIQNSEFPPSLKLRRTSRIQNYKLKIGRRDIKNLSTDERAGRGLFLAFQNPVNIPGVNIANLLRIAYREVHKSNLSVWEFNKKLSGIADKLNIPQNFLNRSLESDFSGGERKKLEMLQAAVLQPKFAIFDEIDTGLDIDGLKTIAKAILKLKKEGTGILLITHSQRILRFLKPDFVHVLVEGKIVESGRYGLAEKVEKYGYGKWNINC